MIKILETFSPEETEQLGETLGREALPGQVFSLDGDLGAGKTVFTRGFARGLGIMEHVTSPTFTILNMYSGRIPLYHFDVYRISCEEEMEEIGYEEYFYADGVCLVEWACLIPGLMPADSIRISMERDLEKGEDYRRITIRQEGRA